mmetsp:Transcript_41746/g.134986  ORF Transcript_41746/g.134986 Transcript_41746/m.134986 type:complete len:238 (+) Transcript_41746:1668-2381(+)
MASWTDCQSASAMSRRPASAGKPCWALLSNALWNDAHAGLKPTPLQSMKSVSALAWPEASMRGRLSMPMVPTPASAAVVLPAVGGTSCTKASRHAAEACWRSLAACNKIEADMPARSIVSMELNKSGMLLNCGMCGKACNSEVRCQCTKLTRSPGCVRPDSFKNGGKGNSKLPSADAALARPVKSGSDGEGWINPNGTVRRNLNNHSGVGTNVGTPIMYISMKAKTVTSLGISTTAR